MLANEEVQGGVSERGGHPVIRIPLRQWMLRITAYADRLEKDLESLDWSESIKSLQRNWIGRSTGEVDFFIGLSTGGDGKPDERQYEGWLRDHQLGGYPRKPDDDVLRIYTTRPDTLAGATYMVIAPGASLRRAAHAARSGRVCQSLLRRSGPQERSGPYRSGQSEDRRLHRLLRHQPRQRQAGPDLGGRLRSCSALAPVPSWRSRPTTPATSNSPASSASTSSPSSTRSQAEGVSRQEVSPARPCSELGLAVNSGPYDGLPTNQFKKKITEDLSARGARPRRCVNYKLRDWLFSRQHFWGEPFPILHELDDEGKMTGLVRAGPGRRTAGRPAGRNEVRLLHASPEPPLEAAARTGST